jgi:hypothetical protein
MRENIEDLQNKYPWLKVTNSLEEYVEPNYYNKILKDYIFDGKSDINIFEELFKKNKS